MRVPDDVTLLWSDDNWGNIRRLPTPPERSRPGGAGIYYHFDYVGDPRDYKWLNTYSITKVQEQMHLAWQYGATREWIVNVGDLKPMEFPIEFFLSMARTPERWNKDSLDDYTVSWATREFGREHAREIAALIEDYTRYNSRRKPEQLEPDTYSLTSDHEAERVEADWDSLVARAEKVSAELAATARPAFFELVLYPAKASAVVAKMYLAVGRNRLYAQEGRTAANSYADEAQGLFEEDAALSSEYNHLLGGKWDHMMDQTHIGYTYWQQPPLNAMPGVQRVQPRDGAHMIVLPYSNQPPLHDSWPMNLPAFDSANHQTGSIALSNRGSTPFTWTATVSAPWIHLNQTSGTVPFETTVKVTIDWDMVPKDSAEGEIVFTQTNGSADGPATVKLAAHKVSVDGTHSGFIERDGSLAIEAGHFAERTQVNGVAWQTLPGFGETVSGVEAFPVTAPSTPNAAKAACLIYSVNLLNGGTWNVQTILAPTLNFIPDHGLRYSIAIDAGQFKVVDALASNTEADWSKAVSDGVRKVDTSLGEIAAGWHSLHLCRVDPGVALERLVLYQNAPAPDYLGPPEATYLDHGQSR